VSKKIVLIENFGFDFYSARLAYSRYLMSLGYKVYALVPDDDYANKIEMEGIKVIKYKFSRKNKGLFQLYNLSVFYRKIFNDHAIDIVHSYRFQPNLLNIFSNLFSKRRVILHVTGLGLAFSNNDVKYYILRILSQFIFLIKFIFSDVIIFQNPDDPKDLWFSIFAKSKIKIVEGSGVDTINFSRDNAERQIVRHRLKINDNDFIFICTTRLIWEKGIREMVDAFENLKLSNVILLVVGWSDTNNPRHVSQDFISKYAVRKDIRFLGKRSDVKLLLNASDVFLYPSYYREGVPRSILEALSMGMPIITTDMPGCNLTVEEGYNGFIVKKKSVTSIMTVVKKLLTVTNLAQLGFNSRVIAENRFARDIVFEKIQILY
jgi:glycosyltransferase involved in cell wall biosynthesis